MKDSVFSGANYYNEKSMQMHQTRLKSAHKTIDNNVPYSLSARAHSPNKRLVRDQAIRDSIAKDNLLLARRIFNIMEGPSAITEKINDTRHLDNHPGTMNFKHRLTEAQRIHNRNMVLASRLDTIKPFYKMSDIYAVKLIKPGKSRKVKKSRFATELAAVNAERARLDTAPAGSNRSGTANSDVRYVNSSKPSSAKSGNDPYARPKSHNVLLEYTKVQDGRVLDVAVIKEPFRDRYAIFGIDIDDGQRYELRLTSDDVSSILEGDILVTSVDNIEVWMALLNKVSLNKVETFAKLPFTSEEVDIIRANSPSVHPLNSDLLHITVPKEAPPQISTAVPSRPLSERPSSRPGGSRDMVSRGSDNGWMNTVAINAIKEEPEQPAINMPPSRPVVPKIDTAGIAQRPISRDAAASTNPRNKKLFTKSNASPANSTPLAKVKESQTAREQKTVKETTHTSPRQPATERKNNSPVRGGKVNNVKGKKDNVSQPASQDPVVVIAQSAPRKSPSIYLSDLQPNIYQDIVADAMGDAMTQIVAALSKPNTAVANMLITTIDSTATPSNETTKGTALLASNGFEDMFEAPVEDTVVNENVVSEVVEATAATADDEVMEESLEQSY